MLPAGVTTPLEPGDLLSVKTHNTGTLLSGAKDTGEGPQKDSSNFLARDSGADPRIRGSEKKTHLLRIDNYNIVAIALPTSIGRDANLE